MFSVKITILVFAIAAGIQSILAAPLDASSIVCVQQPRDLFLIMDGSASVGPKNIKKVKKFLGDLVSSVHIGRDMTHIGLLQFSNAKNIKIEFGLDYSYDPDVIRGKINDMKYQGGDNTMTHLALKKVMEEVFVKSGGDRADVQDVVIMFTDGNSRKNKLTIQNAEALKQKGVRIVAIGAGYPNDLKKFKKELENIASNPKDMKMVDFDKLDSIVIDIVSQVCRAITTTPPPTTTTTTTTTKAITTPKPTERIRAPAPSLPFNNSKTTLKPLRGCAGSAPKDILFVVDGTANIQISQRMASRQFETVKSFIKSTIKGLKEEKFRVGVLQYSGPNSVSMDVAFLSGANTKEIMLRVSLMRQKRGSGRYRQTGAALVEANNKFYELDALANRGKHDNVIVLITRGKPSSKDRSRTMSEVNMMEARNIRMITVGVGVSAKQLKPYLKEIASPHNAYFARYRNLKKKTKHVLHRICSNTPIVAKRALARQSAECRRIKQDIFLVVDGSASLKYYNFEKMKKFLMDLILLLKVERSEINTGLLQFSEKRLTSTVWELGKQSFGETLGFIADMKYQSGKKTMTGDALTRVNNEVFNGRGGDRHGVTDMVVLLTDGNAHDFKIAREQAKILKEKGVIVVTIGAGTPSTLANFKRELEVMASGPEYTMTVDFDDLDVFAEKAFPLVCEYLRRRKL